MTPRIRHIIRDVADETGIHVELILSTSRIAPIAAARHEAIRRVHRATLASNAEIAGWFGRDRTTIAYVLDRRAP